MSLCCPSCGNTRTFLFKTLQTHVVRVKGARVEVTEEPRPAVIEVLCDECDTPLDFGDAEDHIRQEVLLTLGAR